MGTCAPRGVQATTAVSASPDGRAVGPAGSSPVPWGRRCVCGGGSNNRCGSLFAGRPRGRPRHNRQLSPYSTRQGRDTREDGARRPSQVSPEDRRRAPTTGAIRGPGPRQRDVRLERDELHTGSGFVHRMLVHLSVRPSACVCVFVSLLSASSTWKPSVGGVTYVGSEVGLVCQFINLSVCLFV